MSLMKDLSPLLREMVLGTVKTYCVDLSTNLNRMADALRTDKLSLTLEEIADLEECLTFLQESMVDFGGSLHTERKKAKGR